MCIYNIDVMLPIFNLFFSIKILLTHFRWIKFIINQWVKLNFFLKKREIKKQEVKYFPVTCHVL